MDDVSELNGFNLGSPAAIPVALVDEVGDSSKFVMGVSWPGRFTLCVFLP